MKRVNTVSFSFSLYVRAGRVSNEHPNTTYDYHICQHTAYMQNITILNNEILT